MVMLGLKVTKKIVRTRLMSIPVLSTESKLEWNKIVGKCDTVG